MELYGPEKMSGKPKPAAQSHTQHKGHNMHIIPNNTQGQSCATIDKQRRISSALAVSMRIADGWASKKKRRFTYWHFDANCGSGHNDDFDVPGSPIVFHAMADKHLKWMDRKAFFCDIHEGRIAELKDRLYDNELHFLRSTLLPGDNETALDFFRKSICTYERNPQFAMGTMLFDPNGYWYRGQDKNGPPIDGVHSFVRDFPRIDIVLNLNTRQYKLQGAHPWSSGTPSPRELLASLKQYWLVGLTQKSGNQFLLAVGRNMETNGHPGVKLFDIRSEEGQEIMAKVEGRLGTNGQ
jgi:hypothetical protein